MAAVIFNGDVVKALKNGLKLGDGATLYSISVDPMVTPTAGEPGDALLSTLTGQLYIKTDSGLSTNWTSPPVVASTLDPNEAVVTNGSGELTTTLLTDAYIDAAAAIAYSKLANLGGATNRILTQSGSAKVQADASILSTDLILKDGSVAFTGNQSMGGNKLTSLGNGTTSADAVNYSQLQAILSLITNFSWQESCITREVDPPMSPSSGDRYLLDTTLGPVTGVWVGHDNEIAEWNGSSWDYTSPVLGTYIAIDDESDGLYLYGGLSWSKKYFEATTASTGLTKVGFDVRIDSSAAGSGLGFSSGVLSLNVDDSTVEVNSDILRVKAGGIANNEVSPSAAIAYSKLALSNSIVNSDVSSSAAIAYSKLNLASSIVNADIAIAAAIERSKLASGTANHVIINNGSGVLSSEAQLAISRGGTGTSAFTAGSLVYATSSSALGQNNSLLFWDNTNGRLYVGSNSSGTGRINAVVSSGSNLALNIFSTGSNNAAQIQYQNAFGLSIINAANSAALGASIGTSFSRGTLSARTQSLSGDQLFVTTAQGYTGSAFGPGFSGAFGYVASENTTASGNGADFYIGTTPNGSLAPLERIRVKNSGELNIGSLTASSPVKTNASKDLISGAIDLSTAEVTGTLTVGKGGTGTASTPTNGQLLIGNGTNYSLNTITAGAGISVTNGSGTITVASTAPSPSAGDIPETSFSIANNQSSLADITGFLLNPAQVRSFSALVSVFVNGTTDYAEVFEIIGINKPLGGWTLTTRSSGDDSQVDFEIDSVTGQMQYTSGNYAGFVSGVLKFRVITTSV